MDVVGGEFLGGVGIEIWDEKADVCMHGVEWLC